MSIFFKFRFWDYKWYQQAADEIEGWEFPPEIKVFIEALVKAIPPEWSAKLIKEIHKLYVKQGKDIAIAFLKNLMEKLKNAIQ